MTPRVEKRREILLLALDAGPKTTAELAKAAGVDRFVVRQDLVALEAAGLVEHVVTKSRSATCTIVPKRSITKWTLRPSGAPLD